MGDRLPKPRLRIRYREILDQLYTRHGEQRLPFGELLVAPRWLDATSLIAHETMGDGWLISPYCIDLKKHRVTSLPALSGRIRGSRGAPWQVSPDGRWILWPKGSPDPNWLCATRIDGSKHVSFWEASHWGTFFGWMPDNHPVYLTSPTPNGTPGSDEGEPIPRKVTAFIYNLDQSRPIQRIPLPPLQENCWAGVSPDGKIVLVGLAKPSRATVAQIALTGSVATVQRNLVKLPFPTDKNNFSAILSPDGRRLLWQLGRFAEPVLAISSLRGERFSSVDDGGEDIQWHPSGTAISFCAKGLYTMEVG